MRLPSLILLTAALALSAAVPAELESARDKQDRAALTQIVNRYGAEASKQPNDAVAQYNFALASSYLAEVAIETRDKPGAQTAAEAGIKAAEKAVALKGTQAEYHRILGALCGQVIPANVLAGMRYGKCALNSINKAIELDPNSSLAYLSRGVGNYYLPPTFGGGIELALKDFDKALSLNPKSADAYLWKGVALRKANKNSEARQAIEKSLQLNPNRIWAKQQLEKTPSH